MWHSNLTEKKERIQYREFQKAKVIVRVCGLWVPGISDYAPFVILAELCRKILESALAQGPDTFH